MDDVLVNISDRDLININLGELVEVTPTVNGIWGQITGDITDQLDLMNLLDGKADIGDYVLKTGDTMSGDLELVSTYPSDDIAGGTDGTQRLNVQSYQRANYNGFGENIRHFLMRKDAKSMDAYYVPKAGYDANRNAIADLNPDGSIANITQWQAVSWTGSHFEANNHASNHVHWELEIPDSTGALQGRLEVPFANPTTGVIGLDKTFILTNLADLVVRTSNSQALRLASPIGNHKPIEFNHDAYGSTAFRRWVIRANSTAETGSNAGTDFQFARYADDGTFIDSPLFLNRSTGYAGFGTITTPSRISLTASTVAAGGISFGSDTNLYRSATNELKTDDKFVAVLGIDSGSQRGTNFANPLNAQDAATKSYVDAAVSGVPVGNYVLKSGDTMIGPLVIDDPTSGISLNIASDNSGGLNTFDSTGRIHLESYQKAQLNNDGGTNVGQAHYGEVLRIDLKHQQAKGAIAFREDYLGAPEGPRTVAWLVAHGEANDSTPSEPVWHNHFSIELPDENGALQTTFEFPFAPFDEPNGFGMPLNQMYNRSTTQLIAANRGLVVENVAGVGKNIYLSSGTRGLDANRRWGIQADSTAESGSSAGTNYRINRYDDTGTFVDTVFYIRRSDKQVGINTTSPTSQFDVAGNLRSSTISIGNAAPQGGSALYIERNVSGVGFLFRNTTAGGHVAANIVSQSQTASSRALQVGLQSDSVNRFSLEASGLMEWGAGGGTARDTNLYRSAADTLRTDDTFSALSLVAGTSTDVIGTALSVIRNNAAVGRIDNNSSGLRVQAQAGTLQLRNTSNVGIDISSTSIALANLNLGFYGSTPISRPSGVPVTAEGIHAALVNLGLITA